MTSETSSSAVGARNVAPEPPGGRSGRPGLWSRQFLLILAMAFAMTTGMQMFSPILPLYVTELGGDEAAVGLVVGMLTFTSFFGRPIVGRVIDLKGRRAMLIAAAVLVIVANSLYPFAAGIGMLLVVRVVHGIGWSGVGPSVATMAADVVPASRRGEGLGYFGLSRSMGVAVGPAIGLLVMQAAGYSVAFGSAAVFAALGLIIALLIKDRYVPPEASDRSRGSWRSGFFERSAVAPALTIGCVTFISGGLTAFVPLDAVNRGLGNPATFFVIYAVALMLIRPLSGRLSDRAGRGLVLIPGVVGAGLAVLTIGLTQEWWTLPVTAVLYALGFGVMQPVVRAMVIDRSPRDRWGAANATYGTAYDSGQGLGAFVLGFVATQVGIPTMFVISSLAAAAALGLIFMQGLHRM